MDGTGRKARLSVTVHKNEGNLFSVLKGGGSGQPAPYCAYEVILEPMLIAAS